jgi:hypothetical protein
VGGYRDCSTRWGTTILVCAWRSVRCSVSPPLAVIVFSSIASMLVLGLVITYVVVLIADTDDLDDAGYPES